MATTPEVSPETSMGADWFPRKPLNWLKVLLPQHFTPPPVVSAQVCPHPAAIAATPLARPETSTGVRRWVFVASPSWPLELSPQHLTPPPAVRAHVWVPPGATSTTCTTPLARPLTAVGVDRSVVVPSPRRPLALLPQHLSAPAASTAQVCSLPPATCVVTLSPAVSTNRAVTTSVAFVVTVHWFAETNGQFAQPEKV